MSKLSEALSPGEPQTSVVCTFIQLPSNAEEAGHQWLTLMTLASWEAEIRRITV
jgi:hypothetical protein